MEEEVGRWSSRGSDFGGSRQVSYEVWCVVCGVWYEVCGVRFVVSCVVCGVRCVVSVVWCGVRFYLCGVCVVEV